MSGKLIYSLTEENPDLQKQFGCMNVLFQLFDRQHFVLGRRSNHRRFPPVGQDGNVGKPINETLQTAKDKNQKKAAKEKQRNSSESSRTSISSSSCSSTFSSLDCNKVTQLEPTSHETPTNHFPIKQIKLHVREPIDFRDVVKESINREARGLSVHTANKETGSHTLKHIDSPRPMPMPLSKSMKPRVSNPNEYSRTLGKLREAPRFSYDGRESKEKTTMKPKELPRLSLDSRSGSIRSQSLDFKSKYIMENGNIKKTFNTQEEPGNRPSGIVAKLMGLDPLPSITLTSKPEPNQDLERCGLSNHANDMYESRISKSPRNSQLGVDSPRFKNSDSITKLNISLKIPIEHAPRNQSDGIRGSPKTASKQLESPKKVANSHPSVYGEIEKKLTELEFRKSGKDLRALKQILEAMQKTKETLQTKQDQSSDSIIQTCNSPSLRNHDQNSKVANPRNLQSKSPVSSIVKQTCHLKNYGSPIVIMKPATLVRKSKNPTSIMISIEGLSSFHKLRTGALADKNTFVDKQTYKDKMARDSLRGTSNRFHCSTDKSVSLRIRTPHASNVTQQMTAESPRSSGVLSPRLQRKQLTVDKQCHPTNHSSDSSRPRRQSRGGLIELNSQEKKIRPSSPNSQQSDDQVSEISSNTRYLSNQGDAISTKSESNTSYVSEIDADISSTRHSEEMINTSQQGGQKNKNPVSRLSANGSMAEVAIPEQPSPVSVLDAMFYKDDLPSPIKKISYSFEDDPTLNSEEPLWTSSNLHRVSDSTGSNLSFDADHNNLENIEYLVQKLEQLNSPRSQAYIDDVAPFPETKNEDHNYISEILLASGLLSRDLRTSLTTIQLHPTCYLLNPDLFFVLEQSHAKRFSNVHMTKTYKPIPKENIRRKLVFDVVNEILVTKLVSKGSTEPWFSRKNPAEGIPNGLQLTKELCTEIDQLQTNNSDSSLEDDCDICEQILFQDLRNQSSNWADTSSDISGLVLDMERLIFKDLVTEIVDWEARARFGRNGRRLIAK